jgi:alkanesulfonate monooxygenase SsuD/methylene tetrahydromethanopterin reductase-like flavin-dependent oxidoreductase (luciferase family)
LEAAVDGAYADFQTRLFAQCATQLRPAAQDGRLETVAYADRAGFWLYQVAEHHSTPLRNAPSPSSFLASAAQRTRRLRLGPLTGDHHGG